MLLTEYDKEKEMELLKWEYMDEAFEEGFRMGLKESIRNALEEKLQACDVETKTKTLGNIEILVDSTLDRLIQQNCGKRFAEIVKDPSFHKNFMSAF